MGWESAAVALAVGLLIGSERERSSHTAEPGVRTFALGALVGCFAAMLHPAAFAVAVAGAALLATASYLRDVRGAGTTTEVAFVLTVVIGGLAVTRPTLAAAAGVVAAVILLSKERLHGFIRRSITDVEVADALKFFVVAFVVLPLIPAMKLGPGGVVDPRRIWTLVVLVTALGWVGYLAVRLLGPGRGLPLAGLAGGFVSGAATTGTMARKAKGEGMRGAALAGALLASVATLVQLIVVTAIADRRVALALLPMAIAGSIALAAQALWLARRRGKSAATEPAGATEPAVEPAVTESAVAPAQAEPAVGTVGTEPAVEPAGTESAAAPEKAGSAAGVQDRPFALKPALILAAALTALLVISKLVSDWFGSTGVIVAIALAGLADAHAGALTAASMSAGGSLTPQTAAFAALAAIAVNTVVKVVLAFVAGGRRVGTVFALALIVPTALTAGTMVFTLV